MSTFSFDSPHPIHVVRDQIAAEMGEWKLPLPWPFCEKHKLFRGEVRENGFRLVRMIDYQNSYLQVAYCQLEPRPEGTRVHVQLRPGAFGLTFNILWTIGWARHIVACLLGATSETVSGLWFGVGMIAVAWILMLTCMMAGEGEYKHAFKQVLFPKET